MFEKELWEKLQKISPHDITIQARAEYDWEKKEFLLDIFNGKFTVNPEKKTITTDGEVHSILPLCILHYLACSKDLPLDGKLATPEQLRGGLFFFRGAHELPLGMLAGKFGNDIEGFIKKGEMLGGEKVAFGDAAVKLWLLPRVPITFILWRKCEEFESKVTILLDKSVEEQMNLDILFLGLIYAIMKMGKD